jgi:carbon-monoxide dehydrogenase large subunit
LLRGEGRFVDDIRLPGQCHAYFLRSPHAHARITAIDCAPARGLPGILAIYDGADWAADELGHHRPGQPRTRRDGSPAYCPPRAALALDRVLCVGDPVAMVVAETVAEARDGAERIAVDYEPLPALVTTNKARDPGQPTLHAECPDNECFFHSGGDKAAVEAAMAGAHHVTRMNMVINRITANTMEPRACIGDFEPGESRYILYGGTQRHHLLRRNLAEDIFHVPENRVRVIAPDIGGSFGMKGGHNPEYHLSLWAARKLGRPVRWVCERSEGLLTDYHDRDQVTEAALALDADGTFLALQVKNTCNIGAYLEPGGVISPCAHLGGLAGTYKTPLIHVEASAVFSNTASIGPFRGSGRPEASYVLERLIDNAAREMKLDRAEIRRRNVVPPDAMPFKTGLTYTLDCGEFGQNMEQTLAMGDYDGFEARRAAASKAGRLRGLGLANFIEQTAQTDGETISIQFDTTGTVTVVAGSISHGQGHDTMYKIIVSDRLGIDEADIRVTYGDTDAIPFGGGTYASRTAILGGTATLLAIDKIIERGKLFAAHVLEAAATDIEYSDGEFRVAGTDRSMTVQEVARAAYRLRDLPPGVEAGLFETATFVPGTPTFPNGCHVCEVEVDPDTGVVEILRYSVVDDVGTVINALTLAGQIHGGIGQAVGQALTEHIRYDPESGQLISGSFLDYAMPRADDMCSFDLANNPVPTKLNALGAKGAGEAGNVGGLAAIMNAVVDALSPLGITHLDMPATPERVWRAIQDAN